MTKPHSKPTFKENWFYNSKYSFWVSKNVSNTSKAYCKLCYKPIDLKFGGSNALDTHQKGEKHQELEKARKTNTMMLFLSPKSSKSSNVNQKEGPLSPQSALKSAKVDPMEVQKAFFLFCFEWEHFKWRDNMVLKCCVIVSQVLKSLVIVVNLVIH